jgi:hypothetical protein
MDTCKVTNPTSAPVKFSLDGKPGDPSVLYECAPGGVIEVPANIVEFGLIKKLAPALVKFNGVVERKTIAEVVPINATNPWVDETPAEAPAPVKERKGRKK